MGQAEEENEFEFWQNKLHRYEKENHLHCRRSLGGRRSKERVTGNCSLPLTPSPLNTDQQRQHQFYLYSNLKLNCTKISFKIKTST